MRSEEGMKRYSRTRMTATASKPAKRHIRIRWQWLLLAALLLAVLGMGIWLLAQAHHVSTTQLLHNEEQYYFTDSKYKGIKSKFVRRQSATEQVVLEYPITGQEPIDQVTAEAIDRDDASFRQLATNGSQFPQPMTETSSYQVTHHDDKTLSLVVTTRQDTLGAHPVSITHFWTFDKTTGRVVTLRDIAGGSDQALDAIIARAKTALAESIQQQKKPEVALDEFVNEAVLSHFVAVDANTIAWPFGQGAILPSSYGDVTVRVPIADVAAHLQNATAKSIFNVPEPPKPKSAPRPAPPAAQPSASANCAAGKCVALTFDDGPGAHTNRLLDMLDQREVKATFFVLGSQAQKQPGVLRRMQASGHHIGNHSWGHPDLTRLDAAQVQRELVNTNSVIQQATGQSPTLARPPYGAVNNDVLAQLAQAGLASVLWSVDTRDWADRDSQIVCHRAVTGARAGAIILMHDIHATSVDAVPCIIDGLTKQGYTLVTVPQLLGQTTPGAMYTSG